MMIDALETLKAIPQWICYKEKETKCAGEKAAKVPKNPHSGQNGSSTNPHAWGSFMDAVRGKRRYKMDGLGWVFTEEVGILGIDLDNCIDETGQVEAWVDEIVKTLDSYTEISPSGRGLHIFVYGRIPKALGPTPGSQNPPVQSEPIAGIPHNDLFYHEAIAPHLDFLLNRWGLTGETVETFKVGYCDSCPTSPYSASFTTPYYQAGDLVDISHQLLSPNGQGIYRPEVDGYPTHLFDGGLVDSDDRVILVNREFNAMLLAQHYFPVLGLPSTFKREWLKDFEGFTQVYIALNPGQQEGARSIGRFLANYGIDARVCSLPFSPCSMLVKYGCSLGDFSKFN